MSIYIYQIGNVNVGNIIPSDITGIEVDLSRKFRGDAKQSQFSPNTYFTGGIQLPEPMEVTISGSILCRSCISVNDQFNALLSVAGRPYVDVIGYLPNDCCTTQGTCGCSGGEHAVNWLHTTGFIKEVKRQWEKEEAGEVRPEQGMEVEIEAVFSTYWMPLNPYVWEPYLDGGIVDGFRALNTPVKHNFPKEVFQLTLDGKRLMVMNKKRYRDEAALYNIDLWPEMFDYRNGRGRGWKEWESYKVSPSISAWSAPSSAIYAFKNLPTSGTLEIIVESEIIPYEIDEHSSTLDLESVDTLLADNGFTGLEETDIIIATDSLYAPGFIIRDGEILKLNGTPLKPLWTYEYSCVGQLLGVNNQVTIDTPNDVLSAHLHVHRSL